MTSFPEQQDQITHSSQQSSSSSDIGPALFSSPSLPPWSPLSSPQSPSIPTLSHSPSSRPIDANDAKATRPPASDTEDSIVLDTSDSELHETSLSKRQEGVFTSKDFIRLSGRQRKPIQRYDSEIAHYASPRTARAGKPPGLPKKPQHCLSKKSTRAAGAPSTSTHRVVKRGSKPSTSSKSKPVGAFGATRQRIVRLKISADALARIGLLDNINVNTSAVGLIPTATTPADHVAVDEVEHGLNMVIDKSTSTQLREVQGSMPLQEDPNSLPAEQQRERTLCQQPELLRISMQIMQKTSIDQKSLPRGHPEVWADTRQALCETALYYQSYHQACYLNKGVLYSFMFDSNGHARDLIDHDVIIARAGGAMSRDKATKEMWQCRDQGESNQVQAVRSSIASQNPIVIFCGIENSDIPTKMPHRYNSLGWFKPTHVWAERSIGSGQKEFVTIKYRFEKLSTGHPGWWTPEGDSSAPSIGSLPPPMAHTCTECNVSCQQNYLQGWMCLTPNCNRFWQLPDDATPTRLDYDPRFLKQKTEWRNEQPPYDIRPPLPCPATQIGNDTMYAMSRGMCCPRCGKCNSRYRWKGWICSNKDCGYEHAPPHPLIPAALLRDPWHRLSDYPAKSHDWADPAMVSVQVAFTHNYRVMHYTIPGISGRISHMIANEKIVTEPKGPDEMFEALQTLDCGLERRRFVIGKEDYMTSFSCNYGMPYKFIASGESTSFDGAPWPMTETRSRLSWAARLLSGEEEIGSKEDFNELLAIGYFDGQNIKYHDDGENGLGDTVASLSLGYPAEMYFRVKKKHWFGMATSGQFNTSRPLPGTPKYDEKVAAYQQLQQNEQISEGKGERLKEIAMGIGLQHISGKDRKPWLRLRLCHGDIVVMHGREIQEYMEHRVEPTGVLRFALTARTILPEHLKPDEWPSYEVLPDDGHYDGSGIAEMS
ncbi:hypothetical protein ANO11243_022110 [Dothideomycetidae sp. 11243]|nr:hypothetical protein ANO11243_022110 [fungal sp. No.11243]